MIDLSLFRGEWVVFLVQNFNQFLMITREFQQEQACNGGHWSFTDEPLSAENIIHWKPEEVQKGILLIYPEYPYLDTIYEFFPHHIEL